jgi:NADH-quinone oxidoreductase subunit F
MIATMQQLDLARGRYAEAVAATRARILVCAGTGCLAGGSLELYNRLARAVAERKTAVDLHLLAEESDCRDVAVVKTGCHGLCAEGSLVQVEPAGVLYTRVKPDDAEELLAATLQGTVVERLLYRDHTTGEPYPSVEESPFYRKQRRLALANCGRIDPDSLEEYIAAGGYQGLAKALREMNPAEVCAEITASGLRGRGGAGFPTGRKWEMVRTNPSEIKYVICNGDEGDPGAFMNRSLMEGDPHRVLEGMIVAGYAMGATEGIFYVRAEYPLAVERLRTAISSAEDAGLLGENVLGTGFSFRARLKEGAGAFVCGEETALIASIEGKRGMPQPKPPYPAASGLYGRPTAINNVGTLGHVPLIVANGAEWFRSMGTPESPGTATFALTGKVANTGLVEIPMGCTLRDMVYDVGGGIPGGKRLKAVQIGGPSGGCLTEEHLDLGLDFDSLRSVGAMVGSGGLVVIDEDNCMVEVARFFMQFIQSESCGKCVACREGTKEMLLLLQKIVGGNGTPEDLALLEEVADVVKDASLCGLGKTASNPVLSTLRYFRDEYEAHVHDHRCPAGSCTAFKQYRIVAEKCKGCSRCAKFCPVGAISGELKQPFTIDQDKCIACGACVDSCKLGAVEVR